MNVSVEKIVKITSCTVVVIAFLFLENVGAVKLDHDKFEIFSIPRKADYDQLVASRLIRVLVPYSKTFFFFDGVEPKGLAYEEVRAFENFINEIEKSFTLKIHVFIIPTPRAVIFERLRDGYGDVAIGNFTITRKRLAKVDFSMSFMSDVSEVLVTPKGDDTVSTVEGLAGKKVFVRRSSSYWENLELLNKHFIKANVTPLIPVAMDEHLEDEDILEMVNAGMVKRTIVDRHKAEFWERIYNNITVHSEVATNTGGDIAWAVQKDTPQLVKVINRFAEKHKKGTLLGNMAFNKYLRNTKYISNALHSENVQRFMTFEEYFTTSGHKYGFDYRLLAALAYQESRLNNDLVSHAGAVGVMQMLPSTAQDEHVGIANIHKAEKNIEAGAKYLRFLSDRYFSDTAISERNRMLFALASYNAGPSKIRKMREEAQKNGLDPNVWFNNVEVVVAKKIGRETVLYVSNILKYYIGYQILADHG